MDKLPIYDAKDLNLAGMVLATIKPIGTNGDIKLVEYGKGFVPSSDGINIVIEEKYALQLEKFKLSMSPDFKPVLTLKKDEDWEEPYEDSTARRMQDLENELQRLKDEQMYKEEFNVPEDEEAELAKIDRELEERARKMEEEES